LILNIFSFKEAIGNVCRKVKGKRISETGRPHLKTSRLKRAVQSGFKPFEWNRPSQARHDSPH
jgi:hypothetical protein